MGNFLKHKTYPAYKPSGVEWLGEIPAHWEVKRLKSLASVKLSNVDKKSEEGQSSVGLCNYVDVYYNERISSEIDFMVATASEDQIRRFSLHRGDVLITKDSESWTDIAVPALVMQDLPDVICGYHLAHIRPGDNCDGAFLSRALSAVGPRNQYEVAANGITRFGLTGDAIREGVFPLPPLPEQRAIAAFLDRETARIDALVSKKERLIALLQEKRTALITRAVTKGLDPDAPVKDSGVEWLGEIPAHWEIKRLAWLTECLDSQRVPLNGEERSEIPGAYPYWGANSIVDYIDRWIFDEELVLIGEDGAPFLDSDREVAFTVCGKIWVNNHTHVLRPSPYVLADFLSGVLNCVDYRSFIGGATRDKLTQSDMNKIPIQLPPLPEQQAIAAYLDQQTVKLDSLIDKMREAIERMRELRAALISAAVIGQIDVREEAGCE